MLAITIKKINNKTYAAGLNRVYKNYITILIKFLSAKCPLREKSGMLAKKATFDLIIVRDWVYRNGVEDTSFRQFF